jgi:hypothetical protein
VATEPVNDYELLVTVRLHGEGGAAEAATVMESYTGTFVLGNGSEAEIIAVRPVVDEQVADASG